MSHKTPEQIAAEFAAETSRPTPGTPERIAADTLTQYCDTDPSTCAHTAADLTEMIVTAIQADREHTDIYEATAQALDDRSDWDDGEGERAQRAAAHLRASTDERIWERYFGPLLDDLMNSLGAPETSEA